jgi:hypothetical protein
MKGDIMAWLGTWANRILLRIEPENIDETLTDFPVVVHLSAASGIGGGDSSAVFSDISSDSDRKKIAVTAADGETQCYVEIELWDSASKKAVLHVKVPSVSSTTYTDLYLYYDSGQFENTTYVGDTGDVAAQSVWDNNFLCVLHLAQDPTDGNHCMLDSTSNGANFHPVTGWTSNDLVDGEIGKALNFHDDHVVRNEYNYTVCLGTLLNDTFPVTIETKSFATASLMEDVAGIAGIGNGNPSMGDYYNGFTQVLRYPTTTTSDLMVRFGTGGAPGSGSRDQAYSNSDPYTGDAWNYVAAIAEGAKNQSLYVNGDSIPLTYDDGTAVTLGSSGSHSYLGFAGWAVSARFTGKIEEVRYSNIARSAAWLKATHYSLSDEFIYHPGATLRVGNDVASWNPEDSGANIVFSLDMLTATHT